MKQSENREEKAEKKEREGKGKPKKGSRLSHTPAQFQPISEGLRLSANYRIRVNNRKHTKKTRRKIPLISLSFVFGEHATSAGTRPGQANIRYVFSHSQKRLLFSCSVFMSVFFRCLFISFSKDRVHACSELVLPFLSTMSSPLPCYPLSRLLSALFPSRKGRRRLLSLFVGTLHWALSALLFALSLPQNRSLEQLLWLLT